ncbi:MAG: Rrf2 family transcriptional regulator [Deltaproteobacteria bacterium]|nr:Rrf2 family transcriptional regulator [Deltaproteobacteria bacterium]
MIITRATEYSIRAVLHMAAKHPLPVVSKQEICESEGVTPAFLTKILQPLIREGIVRSKRGAAGGFALAKNPEELTLLDVMKATDEPMTLNVCLMGEDASDTCERRATCPVHELWHEARAKFEDIFSRRSLADLARERVDRRARAEGSAADEQQVPSFLR